jgi:hypothetical protein
VFEKALGRESLPVAWCLNDLGIIAQDHEHDYEGAIRYYEQALRAEGSSCPPTTAISQ